MVGFSDTRNITKFFLRVLSVLSKLPTRSRPLWPSLALQSCPKEILCGSFSLPSLSPWPSLSSVAQELKGTRIFCLAKPRWYAFLCTWQQETGHLRNQIECRWVFLRKSTVETMKEGKLVLKEKELSPPWRPFCSYGVPIVTTSPVLSPHPTPSPVSPSPVLTNKTYSVAEFLLLLRSSLLSYFFQSK